MSKVPIIQKALEGRGRSEPHPPVTDRYFAKIWNFRDVDQRRNVHVASTTIACPRQRIGRASDNAMASAMGRHHIERLVERARRQIVVASEHGCSFVIPPLPFARRPSSPSPPP